MEAVGSEVIIALAIPLLALGSLLAYNWRNITQYVRSQFSPEIRIEEN
jgi:hypothetical protein